MADSNVRGRFLWHELMTTDLESAKRFYGAVVGWKTQAYDQDPSYQLWMTGGRGMGGLMAQRTEGGTGPKPQWFNYIGTPDVDATVRQTVELGGKVMRPAWDIPNVGRIAFLNDPQGAMFAVMTPFPTERSLPDPSNLGSFSWHELLSTNWQAAWDFYSKLFAWHKTDSMEMGALGTYQMFGLNGQTLGGMFTKAKMPPGPPFWLAYANVRDSKRAAETITKLGGTVLNGPMEVPGGGWIVTAVDPQGAAFSVFSKPTVEPQKPAPVKKEKSAAGVKARNAKAKVKSGSAKSSGKSHAATSRKAAGTSRKRASAARKSKPAKGSRKSAARKARARKRR